jgi:aminopeptidase N
VRRQILGDQGAVPRRPVIDTVATDPMELLNANSYQKGGFVLHMLRREVGDSAFFRGLRAYYAAHKHGNALTDDLRAAVEREAGRDLRWFFDQWLRRPGYPELDARWGWDAAQRRLVLEVRQSDRFGFWRVPLVVSLEEGGRRLSARVEVPAQREARLVVPLEIGEPLDRIALDPGADLLAAIRWERR